MTISAELKANILRYYHVEKWRVGTISRQLHIHHSTVTRVLAQSGIPAAVNEKKTKIIEPFLSFILGTLKKFPDLRASRLYAMVCERGYLGRERQFRHMISIHRPRSVPEAYLRLRTLPGEQAQMDWAHFGHVTIGRAKRPLMAFVMVLSFSRQIFLRFYFNQKMETLLRGHEAAFNVWQGIPRVVLYDNMRIAVLERQGDAIHFHPTLLELAAHYRFEPRPVAVARGNEKGRVERAIRFVRDNFFAARQWKDIDDLNAQADQWCQGHAANRPCPEDTALSVREVFQQEQPKLMLLPSNPYPTQERVEVKVGKTPYICFDLNDYSVPHQYVRRMLTVVAELDCLSIFDGSTVIAEHRRCYDKGQQIEIESHIKELSDRKKEARLHRGQNRLTRAVPSSMTLLVQAAERNHSLGSVTKQLVELLDAYGSSEMEIAVQEALSRGVPHPNAVRMSLVKNREERDQLPPIPLDLPQDARVRDLVVRPHNLNSYDRLQSQPIPALSASPSLTTSSSLSTTSPLSQTVLTKKE